MPDILIVDDSISVRKALEITLRNHNVSSASAVSAEQALERLAEDPGAFDLLMIDVIMPGKSGVELCEELKADPRYAALPVILMSGNVDDEVKEQAQQVGAEGLLKKPFRSEELIPLVQSTLEDARERRQHAADAVQPPAPATEQPAAEKMDDAALTALSDLLQTYEDHPRVRDVVMLDRQGQPLRQTGNVLPENIQLFARFFTNTAGVLGKQMLGEDIQDVTIRYGGHEMVIHNLPEHFVVVLMGEGQPSLQA
ncbi:response regulator [Deinococcus radiodurans]|jgi:Response regulator containing CheY-like receiver, AAA-type ATPase, and DNA-binding domains|uniref:Response regulator n=1 Tax=Deinococcus radiodurans (strain ATCC 13939 / DSM 20539 / JCM 16871 / CCUG 27074 / LMG 4051 / NBRC 15346 / NCIMB 9279 / VKM B-1422 / R1) TaxID=243230 RepID=Q9RYG1_DEIRA|nr:response regulator [Deinococcus radiodurans]AAF12430.1 response regulator [Deinococcus radiodurans R1 = ATCC 13939 = DSM 20539]ANC72868.1 response regulator [Deinococcus radiodurans R1 = ATCC 13939 = DSM 20539]QEM73137.1 response regulator [Deinococcus radiodurans]QIP30495.1 response regulator [Deinococcus radiodurans]QIP33447.1 response regulator [Deinococcus radiodurans]